MRARLFTFFVAIAAILGFAVTSATTAGAVTAAPASMATTAAASGDFIHLSIYSDYTVLNSTATTHNGHRKIGGFQLTNAGYLVVCDDYADGIFIAGEMTVGTSPYRFLVDKNGSKAGCAHTTVSVRHGALVTMEINTGHTAATAVTPRGGDGKYWP